MPPSLSRISLGLPGLEDRSPSPSLSLQTPSTSLLPTHPHKGLPVSSAAPSSSWPRAFGPISPQHSLPDLPWRLLTLAPHGRPPRSGRPPLGLSDLPWALTSRHGLHRALWAHLSSPLLCYSLAGSVPGSLLPLEVSPRSQEPCPPCCQQNPELCQPGGAPQHAACVRVVGEPAPVFSLQLPSARMRRGRATTCVML